MWVLVGVFICVYLWLLMGVCVCVFVSGCVCVGVFVCGWMGVYFYFYFLRSSVAVVRSDGCRGLGPAFRF